MSTSTPLTPTASMSPGLVALFLTLLLGIQPVTTDLYLPALPLLSGALGASMAQSQLTLSALLLFFGVSQLLFGPLSDAYGRRPVLLGGLALYTLAAVGNVLASNIEWLIVTRAIQGAAMGASVMCARAVLRDLHAPEEGARVMAKAMGGLGVIAFMSPLTGALITTLAGWRGALLLLALFGAGVLLLLALRFKETLPQTTPLQLGELAGHSAQIICHPHFVAWAGLLAACYGGLFTFLAASPFVFLKVYEVSSTQYGMAMGSASLAYIAGTLWCRRLLATLGLARTVKVAGAFSLAGGTLMALLAWADLHTWWAFLLPHYLFMLAHGIHQPCTQTGAVAPFPTMAGTASALSGFFLTLVAFCVGGWLGQHMDGTVYPMVYGVWFWSILIAFFAWVLVQRLQTLPAPGMHAAVTPS